MTESNKSKTKSSDLDFWRSQHRAQDEADGTPKSLQRVWEEGVFNRLGEEMGQHQRRQRHDRKQNNGLTATDSHLAPTYKEKWRAVSGYPDQHIGRPVPAPFRQPLTLKAQEAVQHNRSDTQAQRDQGYRWNFMDREFDGGKGRAPHTCEQKQHPDSARIAHVTP